jgi:hypothetical protein
MGHYTGQDPFFVERKHMTDPILAATAAPAPDAGTFDTPQFWTLVAASATPDGKVALLAHLDALRAADQHALWCAEVNLDGANEHIAELQRDVANARQVALEDAARAAEAHSLAEQLTRMTMANPLTHALNLVGVVARAIRALKDPRAAAPVDSALARDIAADAVTFEATQGQVPERIASTAYPWGWRYADRAVQAQFQAWCNRSKAQASPLAAA